MASNIKIGFDAKRIFNNYTGLGNYSRTVVQNLQKYFPNSEYHLYTPKIKDNSRTSIFLKDPFKIHTPNSKINFLWRAWGINNELQSEQIQIFHGLSHEIPFGIRNTGIKSIVTIHDLIFKHYPEQFKFLDRKIYDIKFKYSCENSDKIIAISESTKSDIIEQYGIPRDKIAIIYQSCDPIFFTTIDDKIKENVLKKHSLPPAFLLYVGSIIERKNLLNIVKALQQLPSHITLPLVVIGAGKMYKVKVVNYIKKNNLDHRVIFLNNVSFNDFPAIYQSAKTFIYPSIMEGFGIPIIEALFSGTPVITSNTSCLPEAGGPNSYYVNPNQPEEIREGITKIFTDENFAHGMKVKGLEYVKRFDPFTLTQQLFNLYTNIVNK